MTDAKKNGRTYTVRDNSSGKEFELSSRAGTTGPDVVDIRNLFTAQGLFTYDPGYGSTASCESKITYIDGDAGILMYRGYPVEQLAANSSFIEVAWLLLYGNLPTQSELVEFDRTEQLFGSPRHELTEAYITGRRG